MDSYIAKQIVFDLRGCAFEIWKEYKWGFSEHVYEAAMKLLMEDKGYKVSRQQTLQCYFKGRKIEQDYRMDLVINDDFIVELKAVSSIIPDHRGQIFNYARLFQKSDCMLMNFGPNGVVSEWYFVHLDSQKIDLL